MPEGELIQQLNALIQANENSREGFIHAHDGVENPSLQAMFREYRLQRSQFIDALAAYLLRLGARPAESNDPRIAVRNMWNDLKAALSGGDEVEVLREAINSEDALMDVYERVMDEPLPDDARALFEEQYSQAKVTHERLLQLRDTYGNPAD